MTWTIAIIGLVAAVVAFYIARAVTLRSICTRSLKRYRELCAHLLRHSGETQHRNEELTEKLPFSLLHLDEEESAKISKRFDQLQQEVDTLQSRTSAHPKTPVEGTIFRALELQDLYNEVVKLSETHRAIQINIAQALEELERREWELSDKGVRERLDDLNKIAEKSSFISNPKDVTKLVAIVFRARKNIDSWSNMQLDALLKDGEDIIRADGPLKWYIPFGSHLYDELQNRNAPKPVLTR